MEVVNELLAVVDFDDDTVSDGDVVKDLLSVEDCVTDALNDTLELGDVPYVVVTVELFVIL